MLRLHPDRRAKASDLVHHVWLEGIVVQGEIDVVRRAERVEREERDRSTVPNGTSSDLNPTGHTLDNKLSQSEADAMKPVETINDDDDDDDDGDGDDQVSQHQHPSQAPPILSPAPAPAPAPVSGAHSRVLHAKTN